MSNYFTCPICGAEVPVKAKACPECGSDENTGWSEEAKYIHLLPDYGDSDDLTSKSGKENLWFKRSAIFIALTMITSLIIIHLGSFLAILALMAIAIIYWIFEIYPQTKYAEEKHLYQKLLKKAGGNSELVERLIELERKPTVKSSRLELIKDAIHKWEQNNR